MAAPDLETLYKFEGEFESAAATFLNTATGIDVNTTLLATTLATPRLDIALELGEAYDPPAPRNGGASPTTVDFRAYNGSFQISVITDNAVGQVSNHATYRAQVRVELMRSGANWGSGNLPYYDLKYLRPDGETYSTDGDFNVTAMSYTLVFEIRDDAWPD